MFDKVRGFLASLGETEPDKSDDPNAFADDDPRVAAAALMFHVVRADGVTREVELETLETLLKEEYDLEKDRLEKLIDTARQANDEAVDFFKFTSVLMRHLTREQCVGFIELLWEIVYADGVRHELEDHVTWRISELLGVSGRERVVMRQRVQERIGIADAAED